MLTLSSNQRVSHNLNTISVSLAISTLTKPLKGDGTWKDTRKVTSFSSMIYVQKQIIKTVVILKVRFTAAFTPCKLIQIMFRAESKLHMRFYMHVECTVGWFFCYGQFGARIGTKSSRITNVWPKINLKVQHFLHHSIHCNSQPLQYLDLPNYQLCHDGPNDTSTKCPFNCKCYYQVSKAYNISIDKKLVHCELCTACAVISTCVFVISEWPKK